MGLTQLRTGGKLWDQFTDWLAEAWSKASTWLAEAVSKAWNACKTFFTNLGAWIEEMWNSFVDLLKEVWEAIKKVFTTILEKLKELWEKFQALLPRFDRASIENIYVRCSLDPKNCNPWRSVGERPYLTFCYKNDKFSFCLGPARAPIIQLFMPFWILKTLPGAIKDLFIAMFGLKEKTFYAPDLSQLLKWQSIKEWFNKPNGVADAFKKMFGFERNAPKDPEEEGETTKESAGDLPIPYEWNLKEYGFPIFELSHEPSSINDRGELEVGFTPDPEVIDDYERLIGKHERRCDRKKERVEWVNGKLNLSFSKERQEKKVAKAEQKRDEACSDRDMCKAGFELYKQGIPPSYAYETTGDQAYKDGPGKPPQDDSGLDDGTNQTTPSTVLMSAPHYAGCSIGRYHRGAVSCEEAPAKPFYYFKENGWASADRLTVMPSGPTKHGRERHQALLQLPSPSMPGHTIESAKRSTPNPIHP